MLQHNVWCKCVTSRTYTKRYALASCWTATYLPTQNVTHLHQALCCRIMLGLQHTSPHRTSCNYTKMLCCSIMLGLQHTFPHRTSRTYTKRYALASCWTATYLPTQNVMQLHQMLCCSIMLDCNIPPHTERHALTPNVMPQHHVGLQHTSPHRTSRTNAKRYAAASCWTATYLPTQNVTHLHQTLCCSITTFDFLHF